MSGPAPKPTAAKSEPAKRQNRKTSLPPRIPMPPEGEPGTLTHFLQNNAVPKARRGKRKQPADEESEEAEEEPAAPKQQDQDLDDLLDDANFDDLNGEDFLRKDYRGPPGPSPPSRVSTSASAASAGSGASDTEAAAAAPSTTELAKRFASHANYHRADKFINEAMEFYKSANREEKHKILNEFAADKSCKWIVTVKESHKTEKIVTSNALDGWMTEFEITDLNKIPVAHPNYRRLIDALLKGLRSMEHPIPEWRNDTRLYQYHHEGPVQTTFVEADGRELKSSADLSKTW